MITAAVLLVSAVVCAGHLQQWMTRLMDLLRRNEREKRRKKVLPALCRYHLLLTRLAEIWKALCLREERCVFSEAVLSNTQRWQLSLLRPRNREARVTQPTVEMML